MTQEQYAFLITQLVTLVTAAVSVIMSYINKKKITTTDDKVQTLHLAVNSRLTELISASVAAAHAEGMAQGRATADARSDAKDAKADAAKK